jgi:aerobic-type carbon monoxide dehydrogenase small subunit (CoxS/CutS family)
MHETIQFKLNDKPTNLSVDADRKLLWVLRTDLGLTGTKYGCGGGFCGACTVLVNNEAVRSCQTSVRDIREKDVVTIEGLAKNGKLHPLQQAFMDHDALQCGYCTSGMIMTACSFLHSNLQRSSSQMIDWMDLNLCRCGAHKRIVEAIDAAAKEVKGEI